MDELKNICEEDNLEFETKKQKLNDSNKNETWSTIENVSGLKELDEPFHFENGSNCSRLRDDDKYNGFDNNVGTTWIYPINKPIRSYQLNISKAALFRNTLVVLPTGLGKTFIAAVVMYNVYRWYPKGKIVFMAPTRPLVTQQIEACCKIMGIPKEDIAEMTGKTNKIGRRDQWQSKRIFFATPQVVQIDLVDAESNFPFKDIKLLVIDEAHKAKGKYAYVEVVQAVNERNKNFRILALSATPGRNIVDVIEIIQNLLISNLEVRYENSIDIVPYTHKKNIKIAVIPLGNEIISIRDELIDLIDPYLRILIEEEVISGNSSNMSKGWLLMEQKRFRERSMHQRHVNHSKVSTTFSICICLYHALELLERHGVRVLINYFEEDESSKNKFFLKSDFKIKTFAEKLLKRSGQNPLTYSDHPMPNGNIPEMPHDLDFGHPKFEKARNVLIDHFESKPDTRAIIFCEFRESVMLMHRILLQNRPLIRPRCFVGQGGTGSLRAVTQVQQIKIMKEFREGTCNTLIATSVAEEGIDVGEVDLIICFDISTKNPTRLVQRIGRTGRMRHGQVIMLATEGKEHSIIKEVLANKDKTNLKLMKCREIKEVFYKGSTRLVPPEFDPKLFEVFMKEEVVESKSSYKNKLDNGKKSQQKVKTNERYSKNNDVRNYFRKNLPILSLEEQEIFDLHITNEIDPKDNQAVAEIHKELNLVDDFSTDYVVTQFENTKVENDLHNTSLERDLEKRYKKLNRMVRHLDKDQKFIDYSKNITEFLKKKNIDNVIKKYVLFKNGNYVKEKLEAMKVIWALNTEINETSNEIIEESENKLRENFKLIELVLGDHIEIEYFVKKFEDKKRKQKLLENFEVQLAKDIDEALIGLKPRQSCENFVSFFKENLNQINIDQFCSSDILDISNLNDKNYDNQSTSWEIEKSLSNNEIDQEFEDTEIDSKYASQWTQFDSINITKQSTPKPNVNSFKRKEDIFEEFRNNQVKKNCVSSLNFQESLNNKNIRNEEKGDQILQSLNETSFNKNVKMMDKKKILTSFETNFGRKHNLNDDKNLSSPTFSKVVEGINKEVNTFSIQKRDSFVKGPTYEISADLFDEDFDHILIESENILNKQSETKTFKNLNLIRTSSLPLHFGKITSLGKYNCSKILKLDHFDSSKFEETTLPNENLKILDKTKNENISEQSMMTISQILDVVAKKESTCANELNTTNPELENFDINDFAEPFEEEEIYISSPDELKKTCNVFANDEKILEDLNKKICSQVIAVDKETHESHLSSSCNNDIFNKNSNLLNKQLNQSHLLISPKQNAKLKNYSIDEVSPSLIKRSTSRLKLKYTNDYSYVKESYLPLSSNLSNDVITTRNVRNTVKNHERTKVIDESIIIKPTKRKKRLLSSSDSETENIANESNISQSSQNEVIVTPSSKCKSIKNRQRIRAQRRKLSKKCNFIEDEANHSSDSKSDDEICELTEFYDSIVVHDDDELDNQMDTDMYLKYIQTTKSPHRQGNGAFKIPAIRRYMDMSRIFSQPIEENHDESLDNYKGSFIVSDEEVEGVEDNVQQEMSPLSKAEAILRKRKRDKCKKQSVLSDHFKRKRILNNIIELSDDEDG